MKMSASLFAAALAVSLSIGTSCPAASAEEPAKTSPAAAPFDMRKAEAEVKARYAKAHPEIKEYVLWTAKTFGPGGMWLNEDAFAALPAKAREERIQHLAALLEDGEYGRHLCAGLVEAGGLKDKLLLPGLMKVAGYHKDNVDYDCRAKWMAVAALARQESDVAVPLLVSLVDHGNENTRNWARAALSRKTGQDFKQDKQAWAKWWLAQGNKPIDEQLLKPAGKPESPAAGNPAGNAVPLSERVKKRFEQDQTLYSGDELREIESLYQIANKQWDSPEAQESLKKLVDKYSKANRTGCALLYLGQMASGAEKEKYLTQAIKDFSDCYYGDGSQVGAYARLHLARYYRETGKTKEALALFDEIRKSYPDAVNHKGGLIVDMIPK